MTAVYEADLKKSLLSCFDNEKSEFLSYRVLVCVNVLPRNSAEATHFITWVIDPMPRSTEWSGEGAVLSLRVAAHSAIDPSTT